MGRDMNSCFRDVVSITTMRTWRRLLNKSQNLQMILGEPKFTNHYWQFSIKQNLQTAWHHTSISWLMVQSGMFRSVSTWLQANVTCSREFIPLDSAKELVRNSSNSAHSKVSVISLLSTTKKKSKRKSSMLLQRHALDTRSFKMWLYLTRIMSKSKVHWNVKLSLFWKRVSLILFAYSLHLASLLLIELKC